MACNFVAPERDQLYLLPPSMADWLPEDHLALFVLDDVEEMDLSRFSDDYREVGRGGAAHHPSAMVALLLYRDAIDEEVEQMFAEADAADEAEEAAFGEARGDEPPAVLRGRADRRRRLHQTRQLLDDELEASRRAHESHLAERAAKEQAAARKLRGRKPKAPEDKAGRKGKKANTTDPRSG